MSLAWTASSRNVGTRRGSYDPHPSAGVGGQSNINPRAIKPNSIPRFTGNSCCKANFQLLIVNCKFSISLRRGGRGVDLELEKFLRIAYPLRVALPLLLNEGNRTGQGTAQGKAKDGPADHR